MLRTFSGSYFFLGRDLKNTVPTAGQNPTSSANAVSTADTANSTDNSAVQTGATTAAAVLAVLLVAGGAVLYTRKRFE